MDDHRTSHDAGPEAPARWFRRHGAPADHADRRPAPMSQPGRRAPGAERNETAELVSRAIRWTYR